MNTVLIFELGDSGLIYFACMKIYDCISKENKKRNWKGEIEICYYSI